MASFSPCFADPTYTLSNITFGNLSVNQDAEILPLNMVEAPILSVEPVLDTLLSSEEAPKPELLGKPLNYPNPFSWDTGTRIGYLLSTDMTVELRIYDPFGSELHRRTLIAGTEGGKAGYNRVPVYRSDFTDTLPAGIYFYVLLYNNAVLGKNKFAVKP
ncbi:MAG: hypothetical protein AB7F28_02970 [Candidatus Margulisiibacteriota bacterium]